MRMTGLALVLMALAACSARLPESNPDMPISREAVDYTSYRYTSDLYTGSGTPLAAGPVTPASEAESVAASTLAALGAAPAPSGSAPYQAPYQAPLQAPMQPSAALAPAAGGDGASISDEQNFAAVAARETIESDAERLARQRDSYQQFQPEPLPSRAEAGGPNILDYALSTTNRVGQQVHRRGPFTSANRSERACVAYASDDLAQEAFLEAGGPQRDRQSLDPDGDGFACGWDPEPFRRAAAAAAATASASQ